MLTSTKLILGGFLGVLACLALVLIGAIAGNRGAVSGTVTLLGIAALGLVIVLIAFASGFVLAVRGLYQQPNLRTWSNIALAIGGLGGVALVVVMLAGCALQSRPQTDYRPVVVSTITEQQSHTTALLQAVSAVDDSVVWVSGHQATWVRTVDGGRSWVPGAMTGPDSALEFRDVEAVSTTTAYLLAAGPGEQSRIYKTTDAGRSWRLQFMNRDSAAFYDCFAFWDETHGIAVSDAVRGKMIVIRTDDGEHWSAVAEDGMPPALPGEGSPAAGGTCLTVQGRARAWFGTEPHARVYRSDDQGRRWAVVTTPIVSGEAAGVATLAFRDDQHGMALGGRLLKADDRSDSVAAVTSDGGEKWTLVNRPTFSGAVYGATVVPGMPGYVVVAGPKGLDWTGNDGRSWTNLSGSAYWAVDCKSLHACWAVGPHGRITSVRFEPPVRSRHPPKER